MEECIPAGASAEQALEAEELGKAVSAFLRKADEEQRFIFIRRYWHLEPFSEIAEKLGCSEGRVRLILFRLRKKLKKYLESEELL